MFISLLCYNYPNKKLKGLNMKNLITGILGLLLIFSISGCQVDSNTTESIDYVSDFNIEGHSIDVTVSSFNNYEKSFTINFLEDGNSVIIDENQKEYLGSWWYNSYDDIVVRNDYYMNKHNELIEIKDPYVQTFSFYGELDKHEYYDVVVDNITYDVYINDINNGINNYIYDIRDSYHNRDEFILEDSFFNYYD